MLRRKLFWEIMVILRYGHHFIIWYEISSFIVEIFIDSVLEEGAVADCAVEYYSLIILSCRGSPLNANPDLLELILNQRAKQGHLVESPVRAISPNIILFPRSNSQLSLVRLADDWV